MSKKVPVFEERLYMWKKVITAILLTCVLPLMACGAEGIETGEAASKGTVENSADTGGEVSGESAPEETDPVL